MLPNPTEDFNPPLTWLSTASTTVDHSLLPAALFPPRASRSLLAVLLPLLHAVLALVSDSSPTWPLHAAICQGRVLESLFFQLYAFAQSDLRHSHCFKYPTSHSWIYNFSPDLFTGSRLIYLITYLSSLRLAHGHLKLNLSPAEFLISRQRPLHPYSHSGVLGVILNAPAPHLSLHPLLSPPPSNPSVHCLLLAHRTSLPSHCHCFHSFTPSFLQQQPERALQSTILITLLPTQS